jgi:hypothetical protein
VTSFQSDFDVKSRGFATTAKMLEFGLELRTKMIQLQDIKKKIPLIGQKQLHEVGAESSHLTPDEAHLEAFHLSFLTISPNMKMIRHGAKSACVSQL